MGAPDNKTRPLRPLRRPSQEVTESCGKGTRTSTPSSIRYSTPSRSGSNSRTPGRGVQVTPVKGARKHDAALKPWAYGDTAKRSIEEVAKQREALEQQVQLLENATTPLFDEHKRLQNELRTLSQQTSNGVGSKSKAAMATLYLPITLNGVRVLFQEEPNLYRADNTRLRAKSDGLAFRASKSLHDWDKGSRFLAWGDAACGFCEGEWVRFEVQVAQTLPDGKIEPVKNVQSAPRAKCAGNGRSVRSTTPCLSDVEGKLNVARSRHKVHVAAEKRTELFHRRMMEKLDLLQLDCGGISDASTTASDASQDGSPLLGQPNPCTKLSPSNKLLLCSPSLIEAAAF